MTAHVIYPDIDKENLVTVSKKGVDFLRNEIGFKGILMTDAIEMKALHTKGESIGTIAKNARLAGCDLILYCEKDGLENIKDIYNSLQGLY